MQRKQQASQRTNSDADWHDDTAAEGRNDVSFERVLALDKLKSETEADDRFVAHERY